MQVKSNLRSDIGARCAGHADIGPAGRGAAPEVGRFGVQNIRTTDLFLFCR